MQVSEMLKLMLLLLLLLLKMLMMMALLLLLKKNLLLLMMMLLLVMAMLLKPKVEIDLFSYKGFFVCQISSKILFQLPPYGSKGYGCEISSIQNLDNPSNDLIICHNHRSFFIFLYLNCRKGGGGTGNLGSCRIIRSWQEGDGAFFLMQRKGRFVLVCVKIRVSRREEAKRRRRRHAYARVHGSCLRQGLGLGL